MSSIEKTARIAGFLYLLVVPLGIFGAFFVPSSLIVPGDAATTASNLSASESLFRLGIVSDLLASVAMLLVVLVLYMLLKPVDKSMALLMVIFVVAGAAISMLNKLNHFAALQLLSGAEDWTAYTTEQVQALAHLYLRMHDQGSTIAFILWGLWLFPLGYLVFKSGFLPSVLGALLIITGSGYLIESFATSLGYTVNITLLTFWGELLFILWLLIKGVNAEQWKMRALESTRSSSFRSNRDFVIKEDAQGTV